MRESSSPPCGEAAGSRRSRRIVLGFLCAAAFLLASACDPAAGPAAAPGAPPRHAAAAALTTTPGTPAHALYAEKGFTCDACHPCGTRSPDGHAASWMDQASAGFHAFSANLNLAGCQACHGPELDGVGGSVAVSCAQCHGAGWRTNCTMCHGGVDGASGAPPKATWGNAADPVRVGAHTAHVAATHGLAQPVGCALCHPVPADALSAGHADAPTATVAFTGLAAQGTHPPAAWDRGSATCANTYCHGATVAGGVLETPAWTATDGSARACDACHGAPPPAPHTASTTCGNCHDGYTSTSVNLAIHVNGTVEAASPHPAGWSDPSQHGTQVNLTGIAACGSCHALTDPSSSCTACHAGAGFPSWDTTCTFCHGDPAAGRANPPVDIQGRSAATNVSVGVHAAHVTTAIASSVACTECHPARTASAATDATHVDGDGIAEVQLGTLARTGGAPASYTRVSATSATCASTYCHGRFSGGVNSGQGATMSWTSTTQVTCTSCHGSPPSTGEHSKHRSEGLGCQNCHNAVASSSTTIANPALHVNGTDDVKLGGTWNGRTVTGTFDPSTRTCSGLACHGSERW